MPALAAIINPDPRTGGVWELPDASAIYPARDFALYNRVSSWGQAGKGKTELTEKTEAVRRAMLNVVGDPARVRCIFQGIEEGKLSERPQKLLEAAEYAARNRLILVASDLSRFIRSESFCHLTNLNAWPSQEEFACLRRTVGARVVLATVEDPLLSEFERRSLATKRTGKAGRPRSITAEMALQIFADLGGFYIDLSHRCRWETPLRTVAKRYGVTPQAIFREADRPSPNGKTWKENAIRSAQTRGLFRVKDGDRFIVYGLPEDMDWIAGPWCRGR